MLDGIADDELEDGNQSGDLEPLRKRNGLLGADGLHPACFDPIGPAPLHGILDHRLFDGLQQIATSLAQVRITGRVV